MQIPNYTGQERSHQYTIVALGESTTDDSWKPHGDGAWPRQLKNKLKNIYNLNTEVDNLAVSGTNTSLLLQSMRNYIVDNGPPDLVIAMMGINDFSASRYVFRDNQKLRDTHFKIFNIAKWVTEAIANLKYQKVSYLFQLPKQANLAEINKYYLNNEELPNNNKWNRCEKAHIHTQLVIDHYYKTNDSSSKFVTDNLISSIKLCPESNHIQFWFFNLLSLSSQGRKFCQKYFKKILHFGPNLSDGNLVMMSGCFSDTNSTDLDYLFKLKGLSPGSRVANITLENHHKLVRLLSPYKTKLIIMSYPTLSNNEIRSEVSRNNVSFVSNKENFEYALTQYNYSKIFSDRFRGDWGHPTQFAHGIIADNLVEQTRNVLVENEKD